MGTMSKRTGKGRSAKIRAEEPLRGPGRQLEDEMRAAQRAIELWNGFERGPSQGVARARLQLRGACGRRTASAALPGLALELLKAILEELSRGEQPAIVTKTREVSTQEAADLLHVSRPFLVKLLEEGTIPHRKIGTHRRVRLADVLAYREAMCRQRGEVADDRAKGSGAPGLL